MVNKRLNMYRAAKLRPSVAVACAVALFAIIGSMADESIGLMMKDSSINFYGTVGWSYQLKGKASLGESAWVDVGDPVLGEDEAVSIISSYGPSGFFMVEATYLGGGRRFISLKNRLEGADEVERAEIIHDYFENYGNQYDFSRNGRYTYTSAIYGSTEPGHRFIKDSALYNDLSVGYEIQRSVEDVSAFLYQTPPIPINGLIRIPEKDEGAPPSPLAIIVHGMRGDYDSEKGFIYLCEQLASHGIIAATIDEYFFNDDLWGQAEREENDARAIVLLEHVKQFGIWNETPGHPLEGKVDMENVMLIGHSRGGEAIELASYFQSLETNAIPVGVYEDVCFDGTASNHHFGPYDNFKLKALVALAPSAGSGVNGVPVPPLEGNYLIIQGSSDEDVMRFEGYKTYERANPIDLHNPRSTADGFKALVWVHGANHVCFNEVWDSWQANYSTMEGSLQRKIVEYYVTAFARSTLFGRSRGAKVFQDNRIGDSHLVIEDENGSHVPVKRVTQYQGRDRLFINHYQEDEDPQTVSSSPAGITGGNSWTHATLKEEPFSSVATSTRHVEDDPDNSAVYFQPGTNSEYIIRLDEPLDISMFKALSLNIANAVIDSDNNLGIDMVVIDAGGTSVEFDLSAYASLWDPTKTKDSARYLPIAVMQTVFIPVKDMEESGGFDITALKVIKLKISDTSSKAGIYFDNLQFVK